MKVDFLPDHIYSPYVISKEMLIVNTSGQSKFELSFNYLMRLSLRKGLVVNLHYFQC
jgi:hypothetical protein